MIRALLRIGLRGGVRAVLGFHGLQRQGLAGLTQILLQGAHAPLKLIPIQMFAIGRHCKLAIGRHKRAQHGRRSLRPSVSGLDKTVPELPADAKVELVVL
ncbi:MAG: hypothetical protein COB00_12645 [Alcanivorax sp.]|nr:MAG: hypothetical protein COB00_12645 [Alcanivorax sp.]